MSVTAPPPPSTQTPAPAATEACPLCGAPLHPEQEWCLSCGAAARTRLAASPGWRGPIVGLVVVLVLSLGVLTGSLVKLAGGTPVAATQTTTVTTNAAATTPSGFLPTVTTTATTPSSTQTQLPTTATTAPTAPTTATTPTTSGTATTRLPTLGKVKGKAKGPVGGINLEHLKKSLTEHLSKTGLTEK